VASAILAELKALHIRPLPSPRAIERDLQPNGVSMPRVKLAPWLSQHAYPAPQPQTSNEWHQVDFVGPIYPKGKRQRYYILVCKDVFDGAVCLILSRSRRMHEVLAILGDCWKTLGRPTCVQFDSARELVGWGPAARYLSRFIRLCLRFCQSSP
jgi:putative transposase